MKILRIGDPHIKPNNIDEAEKLFHFINDTILERKPDRVEILGDLFHTHSVIRLEVLEFWDAWLDILSEACELVVLVGNHDMTGNYSYHEHALTVFKRLQSKKRNLKIVELPRVEGIYGYMPYTHKQDNFISLANGLIDYGAKVLVCHQSFLTSKFESGMYDPSGFDSSLLRFELIISGHIHKYQKVIADGKTIIHPGTPKWDTASDANEDKGIWLYEHDDSTGAIISAELIHTKHVVTKIVSIVWEEGKELPAIESGVKTTVELIGSADWVNKHKQNLKGHCGIKTKITDNVKNEARKPGKDFLDFITNIFVVDEFYAKRAALIKYMKDNSLV